MAILNIPSEHLQLIENYSLLSREQKDDILNRLREVPLGMTQRTTSEYLSKSTGISKSIISGTLGILFNLMLAKDSIKEGDAFPDLLRAGIERIMDKHDTGNNPSLDLMVADLLELIGVNNLNLVRTRKIIETLSDNQRIFIGSEIKLDIRPVFDGEANDEFVGYVNLFNLKITVRENGESKDIYIALDGDDIKTLTESINNVEKQVDVLTKHGDIKAIELK